MVVVVVDVVLVVDQRHLLLGVRTMMNRFTSILNPVILANVTENFLGEVHNSLFYNRPPPFCTALCEEHFSIVYMRVLFSLVKGVQYLTYKLPCLRAN